ncbi:MAG: hypothetical protein EXR81_04630 [Gammaproteobacteria bacterium]|nr:hypothetical protein [Gammaproteobacteria bacterium]
MEILLKKIILGLLLVFIPLLGFAEMPGSMPAHVCNPGFHNPSRISIDQLDQFLKLHSRDVNCPGGQTSCSAGSTCCQNNVGGYSCCPFTNAVCCGDGIHCCPNGWVCAKDGNLRVCNPA